ncbi:hypothetical protein [Pseudogracilibacillus auburnensis]|uniref:hypothetical protein n=1 Tax=Pseudogracilibacillus auburnensis TaxID=1494959 RepID=UPI001A962D2C|nr:hypothetical protein [Pseudogracilibacillus auburnensis]MBO1005486.1 hypothetical protein [Pseudogracilibacillus auburnensis]
MSSFHEYAFRYEMARKKEQLRQITYGEPYIRIGKRQKRKKLTRTFLRLLPFKH